MSVFAISTIRFRLGEHKMAKIYCYHIVEVCDIGVMTEQYIIHGRKSK
jgi:hypothetical protein